jgi:hypothetical protein
MHRALTSRDVGDVGDDAPRLSHPSQATTSEVPMQRLSILLAAAPLFLASPATAATVLDPVGDFLESYVFDHDADLDVTSFSVDFNSGTSTFLLGASLAGPVDLSEEGFYVIGVNTGAGAIDPFGDIGEGNVTFDRVIRVNKDGTATLGMTMLDAMLAGNVFTVSVPLALLPTTGATPEEYGFNLWPRFGATVTGNTQISDFAPENALLTVNGVVNAVPEPATWLTMLLGFGLAGAALRSRRFGYLKVA